MLLVKDIKQKYNVFDILFEKIGDGLILISVIMEATSLFRLEEQQRRSQETSADMLMNL